MPLKKTHNRSIKLLTFDLDNTLWDTNKVIRQAELALYQWLEDTTPLVTQRYSLEELHIKRFQLAKEHLHLRSQISELRKISLELVMIECGYQQEKAKEYAALGFTVFYNARQNVSLFPHAESILSQLKSLFTLGSLTNGNANLEKIGLNHYFDFSLSAESENSSKPAPDQFMQALRLANCPPESAIHIGDHPQDDIFGASQCGFNTIWVNLFNESWRESHRPTEEVSTLEQVIDAVQAIEKNN